MTEGDPDREHGTGSTTGSGADGVERLDGRAPADYDAVVYDLDGTLVSLAVDWDAVAAAVVDDYAAAAGEAPSGDLWELLERAPAFDLEEVVEATIAEHEREGARVADRLARADDLLALAAEGSVPIGVCSLNCEAACRIALERHGLLEHVDVVVGRDTVATRKPDPEPLLRAVRALSATPARTLFVGDSERDELTAERAGTAFVSIDEGPAVDE